LQNLLDNNTEYFELDRMWTECWQQCKTNTSDGITFDDFKQLMKGQPKNDKELFLTLSMRRFKGSIESVNLNHSHEPSAYTLLGSDFIKEESANMESPPSPKDHGQR